MKSPKSPVAIFFLFEVTQPVAQGFDIQDGLFPA